MAPHDPFPLSPSPSQSRRRLLKTGALSLMASGLVLGAGGGFGGQFFRPRPAAAAGPLALPPLPFAEDALAPAISALTIGFHYGKHHQGYVDKLNTQLETYPELADSPLSGIVRAAHGTPALAGLFNNAAQAWNHEFYWNSMAPHGRGGGKPSGALGAAIDESFGSFKDFRDRFRKAALGQFASGWAWLVKTGDGLEITTTGNAETPLTGSGRPLLTLDVWEHAYYLDYQNRRAAYIDAWLDSLVNWPRIAERFTA